MICIICKTKIPFYRTRKYPLCCNACKSQWLRESFKAGTLPKEFIRVKKCSFCGKKFKTIKNLTSSKRYCTTACRFKRKEDEAKPGPPANFRRKNPKNTRPELCQTCSKYLSCLDVVARPNGYIWPCESKGDWSDYSQAVADEENLLSDRLKSKLLRVP